VDRLSFCTGLAFCDLQPRSRRCYPMYVAAGRNTPSIAADAVNLQANGDVKTSFNTG
jgi:hypothetical protein